VPHGKTRNHADRRLPVFLSMLWMWNDATAKARRLLRVLLLRLDALSAGANGARRRSRRYLLYGVTIMASEMIRSRDWLRNPRTNLLAWWIPQTVVFAGLLVPVSARTVIWVIALAWMGIACILNAKRCGRTHCRYTGPYYIGAVVPVIVLGLVPISMSFYGWVALAVLILGGSKVIWWVSERAWGKFS
jgi:hypothetical protein